MSDARCEGFRELISALIDDGLEGGELLLLEAHLGVCPGCRAFEGELRRFSGLLRAGEVFRPLRRPPPGFAAMVTARAADQTPSRAVSFPATRSARRASRVSWLGMAAAAAVAALFFAWSWQRLLPAASPERQLTARPVAPIAVMAAAATDEGSMDNWVREHAMLARDGTLLGSAEEIEFASFPSGAAPGR